VAVNYGGNGKRFPIQSQVRKGCQDEKINSDTINYHIIIFSIQQNKNWYDL
jgi:hypothetical protein